MVRPVSPSVICFANTTSLVRGRLFRRFLPPYTPKTPPIVGRFHTFIGNLAPPCPILAIYSPKSQKEDTTHGHVLFVFCVDKKDQVLARNKTAAQRRHLTASPLQRVAVGSEEQLQ